MHGFRLEDILTGGQMAENSEEWVEAIERGYIRKRFSEIVALTERTLLSSPELVSGLPASEVPYSSACAAARLASGATPDLADVERARVRGLALGWLAGGVESRLAQLSAGGAEAAESREWLRHASQDSDFGSVRGDALADLPEGERAAWQELWDSIESALQGGTP